jgi:hypothetical protein
MEGLKGNLEKGGRVGKEKLVDVAVEGTRRTHPQAISATFFQLQPY